LVKDIKTAVEVESTTRWSKRVVKLSRLAQKVTNYIKVNFTARLLVGRKKMAFYEFSSSNSNILLLSTSLRALQG